MYEGYRSTVSPVVDRLRYGPRVVERLRASVHGQLRVNTRPANGRDRNDRGEGWIGLWRGKTRAAGYSREPPPNLLLSRGSALAHTSGRVPLRATRNIADRLRD